MDTETFVKFLRILHQEFQKWDTPLQSLSRERTHDPFRILIGTILSFRTRDEVTKGALRRLFLKAQRPEEMLKLPLQVIERSIYPVGFYRVKARRIKEISKTLVERYGGEVPEEMEELLKLKGVGRKTANLVIGEAFGIPGVCVDTHVHRISNRTGYVKTKTPIETESALRERLPEKWWIPLNRILVAFGQTICKPIGPRCHLCPVSAICERVGIDEQRGRKRTVTP